MGNQEVAPELSVSTIRIGTVRGGEPGLLVWKSGQLVAILTEIDEESYATRGKWFLEAGFGLLSGKHRSFETVEQALNWIDRHGFAASLSAASVAAGCV